MRCCRTSSTERPGPDGEPVACDTWDNATLHVDAGGFPLTLETKRIAPGETNTWRLRALGMDGGVDFSTASPKAVHRFALRDGRQLWERLETGSQSAFATVTGPIFEFGFSDAILQMWAAFLAERAGALGDRLGCVTPEEALVSHELWAAAQRSAASGAAEPVGGGRRRRAEPFVVERVLMRMRTTVILAALFVAAVWAAPAQAKLVYVKNAGGAEPVIYVADDRGKDPRRIGIGRAPTISPDGRWVAFVTIRGAGSQMDAVVLLRLDAGSQRLVMRSRSIGSLRFSADSSKLGAIAAGKRLRVYDIASDKVRVAASGEIRGYSFSPDSARIVVGKAAKDRFQAPSDLYTGPALGGSKLVRITDIGRAMNPVWGPTEIVFDRFRRRRDDAPAFNLWAVPPTAGGALRQLTTLTIPPLVSGLVPLEISADAPAAAGGVQRPGHPGRLHRGDAQRQDARALDRLRDRDRRLRHLRQRQADPRPQRWRRPGRRARRAQPALRRRGQDEAARRGRRVPRLDALARAAPEASSRRRSRLVGRPPARAPDARSSRRSAASRSRASMLSAVSS